MWNKIKKSKIKNRKSNKFNTKCSIVFWFKRKTIDIIRDYSFLLSQAKYKAKYGRCLIILNTKQVFQRLPKTLVKVKASNTSENLLNKIRQIIYSLYWAKLLKKYTTI